MPPGSITSPKGTDCKARALPLPLYLKMQPFYKKPPPRLANKLSGNAATQNSSTGGIKIIYQPQSRTTSRPSGKGRTP